jgi:hypothetical protein
MGLFQRRGSVRCRSEQDRVERIEVFLADGATCLGFEDRWVRLAPLDVGRLRALLRATIIEAGKPAGE